MDTMYVDTSKVTVGSKTYYRHLIRASYREGGKVKHRTIANISGCSPEEIEAIRLALRHKKQLSELIIQNDQHTHRQGLSFGAVFTLYEVSKQIGLASALGNTTEGKFALWQVIARVIQPGSRLSTVRLAGYHAICDIAGLDAFQEDHLYKNLDWLCENQQAIEDRLFRNLSKTNKPGLYLYDVTSTYLEGQHNELAAFGHNRDKKKGKKQIVIGLLCNENGIPLSIEVFHGNTSDPKTFIPQIRKAAKRFKSESVTFVGDRGMIKSQQIAKLNEEGMHYITAITKPQIQRLLKEKVFQIGMFEDNVGEVITEEGIRYVLRMNPVRAWQMKKARQEKLNHIEEMVRKSNEYLKDHARAKEQTAIRNVQKKIEKLEINKWATVEVKGRELIINIDEQEKQEIEKLDGCYVLKTDLCVNDASKEMIHNRYKDLSMIESAFRSMKTVELEMRPMHVRLESRTRGNAFVVMLSYLLINELTKRWSDLNMTAREGVRELATLCAEEVIVNGKVIVNQIPEPRESVKVLLQKAGVALPKVLPYRGVKVTTKKKLQSERNKL